LIPPCAKGFEGQLVEARVDAAKDARVLDRAVSADSALKNDLAVKIGASVTLRVGGKVVLHFDRITIPSTLLESVEVVRWGAIRRRDLLGSSGGVDRLGRRKC